MTTISRRNLLRSGLTLSATTFLDRSGWGSTAARLVTADSHTVPDGYELAWADEFQGNQLDLSKWDFRTDTKCWSTQLPENVSVANGNLVLSLKSAAATAGAKPGIKYTGAGVISKAAFGYGYYETRMRILCGKGWHSSFWMMKHSGSGATDTSATDLELDVIENDSISLTSYSLTTHKWKDGHQAYGHNEVASPLLSDYHVFGCEYTPEVANYFLDGKLLQSTDIKSLPRGDMNIWLTSIACSLGHTDAVDDSKLPGHVEYDYARFYKK